jgi:hypothetical protein
VSAPSARQRLADIFSNRGFRLSAANVELFREPLETFSLVVDEFARRRY